MEGNSSEKSLTPVYLLRVSFTQAKAAEQILQFKLSELSQAPSISNIGTSSQAEGTDSIQQRIQELVAKQTELTEKVTKLLSKSQQILDESKTKEIKDLQNLWFDLEAEVGISNDPILQKQKVLELKMQELTAQGLNKILNSLGQELESTSQEVDNFLTEVASLNKGE